MNRFRNFEDFKKEVERYKFLITYYEAVGKDRTLTKIDQEICDHATLIDRVKKVGSNKIECICVHPIKISVDIGDIISSTDLLKEFQNSQRRKGDNQMPDHQKYPQFYVE
ncbi:MAG: hypothetical protein QXP53_00695 [Candidatus Pacearchaeota archaeon]